MPCASRRRRRAVTALAPITVVGSVAKYGAVVASEVYPDRLSGERFTTQRLAHDGARFHFVEEEYDDTALLPGYELLMSAPCATGVLHADQIWFAYRQHDTNLVVYRREEESVVQLDPPCTVFLTKIHAQAMRGSAPASTIEIFDEDVGDYILVQESSYVPQPVVRIGDSFVFDPFGHFDTTHHHDQEAQAIKMERPFEDPFDFVSAVDALDGLGVRGLYTDASVALVDSVDLFEQDDFDANDLTTAGVSRRLTAVMEEERPLLDAGREQLRIASVHSLAEWAMLRNSTSLEERKTLAQQWTTIAKIVLVSNYSSTASMDCLRRAIAWHPGFVPAYLQMSSILVDNSFQNSSCQVMEMMLENVDPSEFRPTEMRPILTANFPHCSVIIRMANLWENSVVVRYIVSASVVISFIHGLLVAVYFFQSKCCGCWAIRQRSTDESKAINSSHQRKAKRS